MLCYSWWVLSCLASLNAIGGNRVPEVGADVWPPVHLLRPGGPLAASLGRSRQLDSGAASPPPRWRAIESHPGSVFTEQSAAWGPEDGSVDVQRHDSGNAALLEELGPTYAHLTEGLRSSIVRIQMIERQVNWFEPYEVMPESSAVGTGFAAELITKHGKIPAGCEKDPIFITNAHVVRNAQVIVIQFPAAGQERFEGYAPVIYEDKDLAVVKLADPATFMEYLHNKNFSLQPLPIRDHEEVMGQTVAAIGFPLGSSTLKLSTGVLAGTEHESERTVYQCTAPISPGSSGGPLLAMGDPVAGLMKQPRVVGVNFAAAVAQGAENVNFVVPAIHIQQVINKFQAVEQQAKEEAKKAAAALKSISALLGGQKIQQQAGPQRPVHLSLKMAPVGAVPVHTNAALYMYGGCKEGVYISKVSRRSAFQNASPKIEEDSFIMSVDGVEIDSYGMGVVPGHFLGDPVPFTSIMQIKQHVEDTVKVKTCKNGTMTTHSVSMAHNEDYDEGLKEITEPLFEPEALDYEVFADVTIMQMNLNHVALLIQMGAPPTFGRWLMEETAAQPRLLVSKVRPGSYAATVLAAGMVISSVNGHNVSDLASYREAFEPADGLFVLRTDLGIVFVTDFAEAFKEQLAETQAGRTYLLTKAVGTVAQKHGLVASQGEQMQSMQLASMFSRMLEDAFAQGQASARSSNGTSSMGTSDNNTWSSEGDNTTDAPAQKAFGHGVKTARLSKSLAFLALKTVEAQAKAAAPSKQQPV